MLTVEPTSTILNVGGLYGGKDGELPDMADDALPASNFLLHWLWFVPCTFCFASGYIIVWVQSPRNWNREPKFVSVWSERSGPNGPRSSRTCSKRFPQWSLNLKECSLCSVVGIKSRQPAFKSRQPAILQVVNRQPLSAFTDALGYILKSGHALR